MRYGMLLDGVDDNDYHHTFNSTLNAHLLSSYFSITSKKSSALRALYKKNRWLLSIEICGRNCHQRRQPQETHKASCNALCHVLTLSCYLDTTQPIKIALRASCAFW